MFSDFPLGYPYIRIRHNCLFVGSVAPGLSVISTNSLPLIKNKAHLFSRKFFCKNIEVVVFFNMADELDSYTVKVAVQDLFHYLHARLSFVVVFKTNTLELANKYVIFTLSCYAKAVIFCAQ